MSPEVAAYVARLLAESAPLTDAQIEGAARILASVEPEDEGQAAA